MLTNNCKPSRLLDLYNEHYDDAFCLSVIYPSSHFAIEEIELVYSVPNLSTNITIVIT